MELIASRISAIKGIHFFHFPFFFPYSLNIFFKALCAFLCQQPLVDLSFVLNCQRIDSEKWWLLFFMCNMAVAVVWPVALATGCLSSIIFSNAKPLKETLSRPKQKTKTTQIVIDLCFSQVILANVIGVHCIATVCFLWAVNLAISLPILQREGWLAAC